MSDLTELQKVVNELERRQKEERLRFYVPTPKQMELHLDKRRVRFFIGGNRTGKTVGLSVYVALFALGKRALRYIEDWPVDAKVKYMPLIDSSPDVPRIWVVSETFEVQRDVVQRELVGDARTFVGGWMPKPDIVSASYRMQDVIDTLKLKNGAVIGFKSYDQGREKFQGTSQHLIAYDEEPPEDIHKECTMRVMDVKGTIIAAMTPLKGLTWVALDVIDNDKKPPEKQDPEVMYVQASWDDNPHLSEDEKKRLEATMTEDEREARQYGRFLVPGRPVFSVKALRQYYDEVTPGVRGNLEWDGGKVRFVEDPKGYLEVWSFPEDAEYVIGGDVAEGLEHGDFDAGWVLRRDTLEQVALWHGHLDPDLFGDELRKLGLWYHEALLGVESNNHGLTTITHLRNKGYPNLYRQTLFGQETDKEKSRLGWLTNQATKPLMIGNLAKVIRERILKTRCRRFVEEALSFVRDEKGRMGAREKAWDDVVMAAAIAETIHETTEMNIPAPYKPKGPQDPKKPFGKPGWVHPSVIEDRRKAEEAKEWDDEW